MERLSLVIIPWAGFIKVPHQRHFYIKNFNKQNNNRPNKTNKSKIHIQKQTKNIMKIENKPFQASWNESNQHLRLPDLTTALKVKRVFWNVISVCIPPIGIVRYLCYKIGQIANKMTLPAAHFLTKDHLAKEKVKFEAFWKGPITDENRLVREHFELEPYTVITPDGIPLHATLFRNKKTVEETPTIIYFCANFQLSIETPIWPLEQAIETNSIYNFVLFDYRGVGESQGKFTSARELIIDGSSIVEWVEKYLKTPPEKIHFYGFSLGGAIASLTQALNPKKWTGRNINERSFASSDKMVSERFGKGIRAKILNYIFKAQGYSADPSEAFKKLIGPKMVIYHPQDRVIPDPASMQTTVHHSNTICLIPKTEHKEEAIKISHIAPLSWHEGALEAMIQFLYDLPSKILPESKEPVAT